MKIIIDYKNNTGIRIDEYILSDGYIHITGTNKALADSDYQKIKVASTIKIKWQK